MWQPSPNDGHYRCLYGEIQVLSTAPTTYYCGCNWWPGAAAGGYTGIQDNGGARRVMIFSVWDTSATEHTVAVTAGDARTVLHRFGGEGEGGQSILPYQWQLGETYRFMVVKKQDAASDSTMASTFFYDAGRKKWVYEATIQSPNGGKKSVAGFGGMLNAFLENYGGRDKQAPRLARYRLWVGTTPGDLSFVSSARGDGHWGTLGDWFYLASGNEDEWRAIGRTTPEGGEPSAGGGEAMSIPGGVAPMDSVGELERLFAEAPGR